MYNNRRIILKLVSEFCELEKGMFVYTVMIVPYPMKKEMKVTFLTRMMCVGREN